MERVDTVKNVFEDSLRTKEARRVALSKLPYEEKVRIVVKLQQMLAPILRTRGIVVKVWDID
ncbi:MAG: hypothetical protein LLF89_02900 [Spirochaetaceae bacterium]|nr:hypothetical protein [Spirochaetaceae bacterium]